MDLINDILIAERRISGFTNYTALDHSPILSRLNNAEVYLKCEHQQRTGSFKFRGALNKLLSLDGAAEVVTASTGNHGQGVALAGKITNCHVTVYAPQDVSKVKLEGMQALGAAVNLVEGNCLDAELMARAAAEKNGKVFVSPYNDREVMAGQGTIGFEIVQQCPDVDVLFCAVGGGGLIAGVASYLKHINPKVKIVGCWPENSPAMYECIKAGKIIEVPELPTLSDATAGGVEEGSITFKYCQELIDDFVLMSENEIAVAMKTLAQTDRWMVEGAAATMVAGMLKMAPQFQGKKMVALLSGRNIALDKFVEIVR